MTGRKIPQGFGAGSTKFLGRGNFLCLELVPGKALEVKPELGKLLNNERIRSSRIPALPPEPEPMESGLVFPPLQIWNEEFILQIPPKKILLGADFILGLPGGIQGLCGIQQHQEMRFSMDFPSSGGRS